MKLLVGLGNPGVKYEKTRHNIGFMFIEKITNKMPFQKKFNVLYRLQDKLILVMPQTYMNNSGEAIGQIMRFYKIPIKHLYEIHDDIDLRLGQIKIKIGGGNGGHNGLKSIDKHIGVNYMRIRLGVGRPENGNVADYVLQNFQQDELLLVEKMLNFINLNLQALTQDNISQDEIGKLINQYK